VARTSIFAGIGANLAGQVRHRTIGSGETTFLRTRCLSRCCDAYARVSVFDTAMRVTVAAMMNPPM